MSRSSAADADDDVIVDDHRRHGTRNRIAGGRQISVRQSSSPSVRRSATRLQSGVSTNSVSFQTAAPRLPICQPPLDSHVVCQSWRPVRASNAHTWSGIVTYMMPVITSGVPLMTAALLPPPPCGDGPGLRRLTQARVRESTFESFDPGQGTVSPSRVVAVIGGPRVRLEARRSFEGSSPCPKAPAASRPTKSTGRRVFISVFPCR